MSSKVLQKQKNHEVNFFWRKLKVFNWESKKKQKCDRNTNKCLWLVGAKLIQSKSFSWKIPNKNYLFIFTWILNSGILPQKTCLKHGLIDTISFAKSPLSSNSYFSYWFITPLCSFLVRAFFTKRLNLEKKSIGYIIDLRLFSIVNVFWIRGKRIKGQEVFIFFFHCHSRFHIFFIIVKTSFHLYILRKKSFQSKNISSRKEGLVSQNTYATIQYVLNNKKLETQENQFSLFKIFCHKNPIKFFRLRFYWIHLQTWLDWKFILPNSWQVMFQPKNYFLKPQSPLSD